MLLHYIYYLKPNNRLSITINKDGKTGFAFQQSKTQVQFFRSSTLGSQLNSNTLNLNILGKDNIVCVSLVNETMCLNSIGEPNVPHLKNCT